MKVSFLGPFKYLSADLSYKKSLAQRVEGKKTKRVFFFEAPVDLSRPPLSQSGGGPSPFSVDPTWVGLKE